MAVGPQKPDHRGKFTTTPAMLLNSVAWRSLSMRARAALQIIQLRHNGYNNGAIQIGVQELAHALGNKNYAATGEAIAELWQKGFLEPTSPASQAQSKTRRYRLTFVTTGEGKRIVPATNEYLDWRPSDGNKRKFFVAEIATQTPVSVVNIATQRKVSIASIATQPAETPSSDRNFRVANTASVIVNHSSHILAGPGQSGNCQSGLQDVDTLRRWLRLAIDRIGYGGAKRIAEASGIPEPTLSKFRAGRGLPERHRAALQFACAKFIRFDEIGAAA